MGGDQRHGALQPPGGPVGRRMDLLNCPSRVIQKPEGHPKNGRVSSRAIEDSDEGVVALGLGGLARNVWRAPSVLWACMSLHSVY